jgi:hypothetical protein
MTYAELSIQMEAEHPEVVISQMFGMPVLKTGKKAFAGEREGDMVFKLPPDEYAAAAGLPAAHDFEPMPGRKMGGWLVVPAELHERWPELAEQARAYVAALNR